MDGAHVYLVGVGGSFGTIEPTVHWQMATMYYFALHTNCSPAVGEIEVEEPCTRHAARLSVHHRIELTHGGKSDFVLFIVAVKVTQIIQWFTDEILVLKRHQGQMHTKFFA